jgi:hypothetical protein
MDSPTMGSIDGLDTPGRLDAFEAEACSHDLRWTVGASPAAPTR